MIAQNMDARVQCGVKREYVMVIDDLCVCARVRVCDVGSRFLLLLCAVWQSHVQRRLLHQ